MLELAGMLVLVWPCAVGALVVPFGTEAAWIILCSNFVMVVSWSVKVVLVGDTGAGPYGC